MKEPPDVDPSSPHANPVRRARAGEFREYWLQRYIQENYEKLGFSEIEGPFEVGPDFKGLYAGERVTVEAETKAENFVYHRHDPKQVDILIVLADDRDEDILGMPKAQWRRLLPTKIIKVDAEDFVESTHEMRKAYALMKAREAKSVPMRFRLTGICAAFEILWSASTEEDAPQEGTPEWDAFKIASSQTAAEYIHLYHLHIDEGFSPTSTFTRIEILANDIIKSRRGFNNLNDEENDFIANWTGIFRENWSASS